MLVDFLEEICRIDFLANDRKNQDLAEDENRASNDEDAQQSNNSEENTNQGILNNLLRINVFFIGFNRSWSTWRLSTRSW